MLPIPYIPPTTRALPVHICNKVFDRAIITKNDLYLVLLRLRTAAAMECWLSIEHQRNHHLKGGFARFFWSIVHKLNTERQSLDHVTVESELKNSSRDVTVTYT